MVKLSENFANLHNEIKENIGNFFSRSLHDKVLRYLYTGKGCEHIREFRENQGVSFSIRENQGEKKDILKNQGKSGEKER